MKHLTKDWMDTENPVSIGDPDDFILRKDDDDGGEGRQTDADVRAETLRNEIKRIQEVLDKALKNPLFKHQAD